MHSSGAAFAICHFGCLYLCPQEISELDAVQIVNIPDDVRRAISAVACSLDMKYHKRISG
jgi:hypothetical protein